ncbi:MAG: Holliday junction resolvase RuvX [Bacteroidetes bacterium]|nr:Holliday junction resolvase RuvX [bacterium]NBP64825.1 Holliday junction resolvase RuvX [Bacteroidota bacterium]
MNMFEHLKGKRLLALDMGKKRIGIAVCDILHITTTPLITLEQHEDIKNDILNIIAKEQVGGVIIGMPKESVGQSNGIIRDIKDMEQFLQSQLSIAVILHDESFSSKEAVSQLIASGRSQKYRKDKSSIDKTAAAIILRSFLDEYDI